MSEAEIADHHRDIVHRLTNHPPVGTTGAEGREKSLALTKLEELSFWSKAAVARNQQ